MKNVALLALAVFFFFGCYRYLVQPYRIKEQFPEHPIGHSPAFLVRSLGVIMGLVGAMLVYLYFKNISE